jgi:hypothetical protein
MYTLGASGLVAAYIFVAVIVISINLYSKWSWPVKAGTIVLATVFYFVSYLSLPQLLGWPVRQELPESFRLLAAHVQQPDKLTRDEGAIYLWITDARDLARPVPPRAYRFPYSGPLHETVIAAVAKLKQGTPQLGEARTPDSPQIRVLDDPTRLGQESAEIRFYDVPDPLFPDK